MSSQGFTLFDTALGLVGISWTPRGIATIQLPERTETATVRRLLDRTGALPPASPPPWVRKIVTAIRRHLAGRPQDLGFVKLDLDGITPFRRKVYRAARRIAPGRTRSYGELAAAVGSPRAARAVGLAMAQNPFSIVVPCHRVRGASGATGGFSAHGGVATKRKLLAMEGASG